MRTEYEFSNGVRGKYAQAYQGGSNVIVLDPDVAAVFPDAASVNRALRALAEVAEHELRARKKPSAEARPQPARGRAPATRAHKPARGASG